MRKAAFGDKMIALRLTVPFACWRKGHAREFLESEILPPPATCYGALLSLVGEIDRERHRGCRVTAGLLNRPERSTILRTLWQTKNKKVGQGNGVNAGPDFQELVVGSDLVLWCDSSDEAGSTTGLEGRVRRAIVVPSSIDRFGGWSLGQSQDLINDLQLLPHATPPVPCRVFLLADEGPVTLPVWVDHVGSAGTHYAVGELTEISDAPSVSRLPQIPLASKSTEKSSRTR